MADFNRPKRFGSNRSFGRRDFPKRNFSGPGGDRPMYPATCSNCGKDCQVPFRPTGNKPVFCSDCFEKNNAGTSRPRRFDRDTSQPDQYQQQFSQLHAKLDKILSLLESSPIKTTPKSKPPKSLPKKPVVLAENPPAPDPENNVSDLKSNPDK